MHYGCCEVINKQNKQSFQGNKTDLDQATLVPYVQLRKLNILYAAMTELKSQRGDSAKIHLFALLSAVRLKRDITAAS